MRCLGLWLVAIGWLSIAGAAENGNMAAFPPAEPGYVRHLLKLPEMDDEASFRVQLIVGKTVEVDARNRYFFVGAIQTVIIPGWGFPRYKVQPLGPLAGTLMAVDPNEPKVSKFIAVSGEPFLIRYNSRLPIVVYAPEGVEVRYRLWSAAAETTTMSPG